MRRFYAVKRITFNSLLGRNVLRIILHLTESQNGATLAATLLKLSKLI